MRIGAVVHRHFSSLSDGCPLFTCIFIRHQFVQRLGYLCKLEDKLVIVPSGPKKALDLSDGGRVGPLFDDIYFLSVGHYTLGRYNVPQVCDLSLDELAFQRFEFKSGLFQLLEQNKYCCPLLHPTHGLVPRDYSGCWYHHCLIWSVSVQPLNWLIWCCSSAIPSMVASTTPMFT